MGSALITGAGQRLGLQMAMALARRGWSIVLHHHTTDPEPALEQLRALGVRCTPLWADLTDAEGLLEKALRAHPDLKLVVNSASLFDPATLRETTLEVWERQWAINMRAPFLLARDFARHVGEGVVVNVLDSRITTHRSTHAAYLLTKKALADFTQMAAREWAPHIRVNGLALGPFLAPVSGNPADVKNRLAAHPLQRCGTPEELSSALLFLVENSYVTGQILYLDGGERL